MREPRAVIEVGSVDRQRAGAVRAMLERRFELVRPNIARVLRMDAGCHEVAIARGKSRPVLFADPD